jgi:hypothetical protein
VVRGVIPARGGCGAPTPPRGGGLDDEGIRAVSAYAFSLSRARTTAEPDTAAGR